MRAVCVIVFLLCALIMPGCGQNQIVYSDTFVFGQDHQYYLEPSGRGGMCESDDGFYFLSGPSFGFLHYYDIVNRKSSILCNKPDCLHSGEPEESGFGRCNAYLGAYPEYIAYYQNNIYYTLTEFDFGTHQDLTSLYRISPDGTQRRKLYTFQDHQQRYIIHRGYLYYTVMIELAEETDESLQLTRYSLYRLNLANPGAGPELLDEVEKLGGSIGQLMGHGNTLYYRMGYYTDNNLESSFSCIKRYDIQTKTIDVFLENKASSFTVFNGRFVYSIWRDKATYACDFDGGNQKEIFGQFGFCFSNGNYLFIDSDYVNENRKRTVTIIDKGFNVVKQVDANGFYSEPMGCCGEYYFLYKEDFDGDKPPVLYGIPVSQITDDTAPVPLQ